MLYGNDTFAIEYPCKLHVGRYVILRLIDINHLYRLIQCENVVLILFRYRWIGITGVIFLCQSVTFMSVLDKHAPIKTKTVNTQVPYMNSALRKAINQRNMWRSKYFRNRNDKQLRMKYVVWRNRVVKLHKNSIRISLIVTMAMLEAKTFIKL